MSIHKKKLIKTQKLVVNGKIKEDETKCDKMES